MKRKAFLKTYATRIALTLLLLSLIVYAVYHALGNSSAGLLTAAAKEITDTRYLEGEGYVFRSETVLEAEQTGLIDPLTENGSKVGKNAQLVRVYPNTGVFSLSIGQTLLDAFNRQIQILQNSLPQKGESLANASENRAAASRDLLEIEKLVRAGSFEKIPALEEEMLALLGRYESLTQGTEAIDEALEQTTAQKQELLTGDHLTVTAATPGYFYSRDTIDGYETIFTEAELQTLTYTRLRELSEKDPAPLSDTAVGKFADSFEWYFVMPLTGAEQYLTVGESYTVTVDGSGEKTVQMCCERIVTGEETPLAVFSCGELAPGEALPRIRHASVLVSETRGYYIPEQALTWVNGQSGVYVFESSTVYFRRAEILFEGDGYYVASLRDSDPENEFYYLSGNDLLIVSGKNLYHGKVYQ